MDPETETLVKAVRPIVKSHIRHTQNLLGFLTELDKRLDAESQKEADRSADKETARVG